MYIEGVHDVRLREIIFCFKTIIWIFLFQKEGSGDFLNYHIQAKPTPLPKRANEFLSLYLLNTK